MSGITSQGYPAGDHTGELQHASDTGHAASPGDGRGTAMSDPTASGRLAVTEFGTSILLTVAAVLMAIGLSVLVAVASSTTLMRETRAEWSPSKGGEKVSYAVSTTTLSAAVVCGLAAVRRQSIVAPDVSGRGPQLFNRYLIGVGYALALLALLNFVALAGFARVGQLIPILSVSFTSAPDQAATSVYRVLFMVLAPDFAVLGALFFTANSLRLKREGFAGASLGRPADGRPATPPAAGSPGGAPVQGGTGPGATGRGSDGGRADQAAGSAGSGELVSSAATTEQTRITSSAPLTIERQQTTELTPEPFDTNRFWGGLWFRLGEAVLFTLVVFLLGVGSTKLTGASLLLVALLLGMFVKTGEGLIAGIAEKVFAAVSTIVK
jgi:hypothetical protein